MKLSVVHRSSVPASASPYRLLDEREEIAWANSFLDAQRIRQLSVRSLRAYAYDLLHFARWWSQHPAKPLSAVTESTLLDYVRYQLDQQPKPTPQTVNHRLVVLHCLYSTIWPLTATPLRQTSSAARTFLPRRGICPDRFLSRTINCFSRNCNA
jgi:hypothetical protein